MPRELRAALAAGTLVLTAFVAGCGDGGKTTGLDDRGTPAPARARPVGNVVKASSLAGSAALAAGALATTDLSTLTPTDLVTTMVGSGVSVSNIHYTGAASAAGKFTSSAGIVGFESGILLSTGDVKDVAGPNEADDITTVQSTPGDPDLTTLAGFETFDAAVLTFDFVPAGETVTFEYVFASDEYNEYVNTNFNDVFAFYVNGTNCAVVGNPSKPVSINTINGGNPTMPAGPENPSSNPALYRNNDLDDGGGSITTEMDGLTTVLTCEAPVNPGVKNTMKIAIADASDAVLDATVFIKAGSFAAPNEPPAVTISAPATGSLFTQGATLSFAGSATDPEDGALSGASLVWKSSIDGTLGTGTSISTAALSAGTHTITLTGTDAAGAAASATIQITITAPSANHAPVPVLGGPSTGDVGASLAFTTGATDPDGDSPITCEISFGGAFTELSSCNAGASHAFTAAGTYNVALRAHDPGGLVGTATWTVTVSAPPPAQCSAGTGQAPTLRLFRAYSRNEVGPFDGRIPDVEMVHFGFSDPDCGPWRVGVDWGDGVTDEFTISAEQGPRDNYVTYHDYATPGSYEVRMTITDAAGRASAEQRIAMTAAASSSPEQ